MSTMNDFIIKLQAMIDESSLDREQKKLLKRSFKIAVTADTEASQRSIDALANSVLAFKQNNSKMSKDISKQLDSMYNTLINGANISKVELNTLKDRFTSLKLEVRDAGQLGKSFSDSMKQGASSFISWLSATNIIMSSINTFRNMLREVKNLDTALVDLKKTTNATSHELEEFYYSANDTAKQLGVTTEEIINATSAWSRLGYAIKDASTMAKNSAILASISPEMDIESATDGLVSVLKAFNIEAEDSLDGVISKINIIGNTQAVDNNDIIDILTRSSSAMAEANNTLEQTIALGTAATEITRDADSVGTALKTISMRIRGYDEETEEYIGGVEELSGVIADLTKTASAPGGISLFTDSSKTEYKSTYQILKDISEIYDELSDKQQADLLEALAGKRQGQIVSAMLNNFEAVETSMDSMANSAGNAMKEMEIIYDSMDYKLNETQETAMGIAQNLFGREDMKAVIDVFNGFLGVLDTATEKLGLFNTIALGTGAVIGGKKLGAFKVLNGNLTLFNKTLISTNDNTTVSINRFTKLTNAFSRYNSLSQKSDSFQKAYNEALIKSDTSLSKYLKGLNGAKASMGGYIKSLVGAKVASVGLQVASVALNTALSLGLSLAINALVSAIDNWINKEKEARETAKETAQTAKETSNNLSDLLNQYNRLSKEIETNSNVKEDLLSVQSDLLEALGIEESQIDDLIEKYGDLDTAINKVTLDSLRKAQADLMGAVDAYEEELLDAGSDGFWGGNNVINASGDGTVKAFEILEKAGLVDKSHYGTNGGTLILTGDDSTVEGILENYEKLKNAQEELNKAVDNGTFTMEEMTENPLYKAINTRLDEIEVTVDSYNTSIDDLNKNIAQQQILSSISEMKVLPKTKEEFESFKQSMIDTAVASTKFIGSQEDIEDSIINVLSTMPEFKEYFEELSNIQCSTLDDKTGNLSTEELNKNINTAFDSIKKSHSALQEFKEAMSNGMTESALDGVAGLSDELKALVAEFHAGTVSADELYSALTEHYNTDLENYGKALIEKNQDNAEFYNRVGLNDSDFVNHMLENYKVDLSNCKDYNQARTEIELKTIRTLGDMWSKYYNIQTDTYTSQLNSLAQSAYGAARAGVSDEDNEALQLYKQITGQVTNYRNAIKELENIAYNGIESSFEGIGGGSSSSKSSSKTTFDWIETKISRIQRQISNFGKTVSATWLSWSTRNNALLSELSAVNEEIVTQKQAYEKYLSLANSVGLSEPYKSLVQSGGLRIDTITDENLKEKIQLYQDYYEKHLDTLDAYNEGATTLAEKTREQFDLAASEYDSYISTVTSKADILNAYIDQVEARGHMVSKSYYEELKKVEQSNISSLQSKYSQLTSILNNAVTNGTIKKGSEEYNNMKTEIDGVQQALIEANTALIEYDNTMRDLDWEVFDKIQDKISGVIEEADFLIDLMSDEKMFDGGITEYGQATMGLHAINYETYMNQSKKYGEELLEINKQLADDPNNWTLIERRQELLELQREAILNAQDQKDSIIDLVSQGYDELLDSLDSAIEKYNELMDVERDLYDYEKSVSEQTANIASLRKQLMAYSGDNSESAKSKIQQITVDLEKAEQELQETEMDKNIQDRQQLLTALKDEAELFVSEKMDNQEQILKEVIAETNIHIDAIKDTLDSQTSAVGTALSEEMNKIFGEGSSFVSIESTISTTLTDIKNLIQSMSSENNVTNVSSSSGNTNIPSTPSTSAPTTPSTPSTPSTTNVSNGSSSKWEDMFIYKKDSYPKNKLNVNTSIVDRIKFYDWDSSFQARASYYQAMGLGSASSYKGSAKQNTAMIAEMKKHKFAKGGTIGSLIKSTGEDGFVLARTGEEILSLDKIKELGFTFEKMKPIVDTMKILPNVQSNVSNKTMDIKVDIGDIQMYGVNDPEQFATQLKGAINNNSSVRKMLNDVTLGDALGHNSLTRYTR